MSTDIQISIVGSAGDGTIAAGDILKNALAGMGYKIISFDIYPPEIRGFGKCIARMRITTEQAYSLKHKSDVLISLDDSHAIPHANEVRECGAVIYERASIVQLPEGGHISAHIGPGQLPYPVPIRELAEKSTSANRSRNIVVLGFLAGLLDLPDEAFLKAIARKFKRKAEAAAAGEAAYRIGREFAAQTFKLDDVVFGPPVSTRGAGRERRDDQRQCRHRARRAGCRHRHLLRLSDHAGDLDHGAPGHRHAQARRPPAADRGRDLGDFGRHRRRFRRRARGDLDLRAGPVADGRDARHGGDRRGAGRHLRLAARRPSTGLPTKTEQSDLHMAVFGGHGDAPRIVIAPTNVDGCYRCAGKAFELAEAYQTPVIVLVDLYLSNRYETVVFPARPPFEADVNRKPGKQLAGAPYKRYALGGDSVSPRAIPGEKGTMHVVTGLEHNELGRPSDQGEMHEAMSRKRHEKLQGALKHPDLTVCKRFGDEGAVDVGVISWGSNFGESLEAMLKARGEGIRCAAMKVVMLSPFPTERVAAFLADCKEVLVPELNYQGQFANLLQAHVARPVTRLNRVPGEPMKVEDILEEIRRLAGKKAAQKAA
ncbi:MAG: 2-oxoacid:acceptor oxidoreductase family protein [Rhodocyclaceae bacterium]|nr:2-oxoacid:acceptor oxidoreductase family protein [Rhodocyclaceae bacterium]